MFLICGGTGHRSRHTSLPPTPLFLPSCSPRDFRSLRSARRPSRFQESSDSDGSGGGGRAGVRDDAPELHSPALALEPKATPHPAPPPALTLRFHSLLFSLDSFHVLHHLGSWLQGRGSVVSKFSDSPPSSPFLTPPLPLSTPQPRHQRGLLA